MATNTTTEVLKFEVDQGAAITELERTKRSIIGLKEEQQNLQKAYKAGHITQEEYAKELVRTEAILKRETAQYSNLQKSVTGVKTETGKLTQALKENTQQLQIGGTNVGALTAAMTKLLSPVGAAVGVVGLLTAAYARSAAGANDFARAQLNLQAVIDRFSNQIGNTSGGRAGFFEWLSGYAGIAVSNLTASLQAGGRDFEELSAREQNRIRVAQDALKQLRELEIQRVGLMGEQKQREREAELARRIRDDQEKSIGERLAAAAVVREKIEGIETRNLEILEKQVGLLTVYGEATGIIFDGEVQDLEMKKQIVLIENEIADKKEFVAGKLTENVRAEQAILQANQQQLQTEREKTSELERQQRIATLNRSQRGEALTPLQQLEKDYEQEIKITTSFEERMAETREYFDKKLKVLRDKQKKDGAAAINQKQEELAALILFSNEAARLMDTANEQSKEIAAAQLLLNAGITLSSIVRTAAKLSAEASPIAGALYFAAAIASATANIAQAAKLVGVGNPLTGVQGTTFNYNGKTYIEKGGEAIEVDPETGRPKRFRDTLVGRFFRRLFGASDEIATPPSPKYASGGYTGPGGVHEVAGTVHRGEVVWSQKDVAAVGGPAVANAIRPTFKGYADGGLVTGGLNSNNNMPAIQVFASWTEMVEFGQKMKFKENMVRK